MLLYEDDVTSIRTNFFSPDRRDIIIVCYIERRCSSGSSLPSRVLFHHYHFNLMIKITVFDQSWFRWIMQQQKKGNSYILIVYLLYDHKLLTLKYNSDCFLKQTKMSFKGVT